MSPTESIEYVAKPFNGDKKADVVIRTGDDQRFFVHECILSLASPVFGDMFACPQPSDIQTTTSSLPEIYVQENSYVIDCLLRICYPVAGPKFEQPGDVDQCLRAAKKYDMQLCVKVMEDHLTRLAFQEGHYAYHTYAIACRWGLENAASMAALIISGLHLRKHSNRTEPVTRDFDDPSAGAKLTYKHTMCDTPAGAFYRLLKYVYAVNLSQWGDRPRRLSTPEFDGVADDSHIALVFQVSDDAGPPDIIIRTSDGVEYKAHRRILRSSSSILDDIPNIHDATIDSTGFSLPEADVLIDSTILPGILHICYQDEHTDWTSSVVSELGLKQAEKIYMMALRYHVLQAKKYMIHCLRRFLSLSPLRVYLISARLRLDELAREAAVQVVQRNLANVYDTELEDTEARYYYALLQFVHEYKEAFFGLVSPKRVVAAKGRWSEIGEILAGDGEGEAGDPDVALAFVLGGMKKGFRPNKVATRMHAEKRFTRGSKKLLGKTTPVLVPGVASAVLAKVRQSQKLQSTMLIFIILGKAQA